MRKGKNSRKENQIFVGWMDMEIHMDRRKGRGREEWRNGSHLGIKDKY